MKVTTKLFVFTILLAMTVLSYGLAQDTTSEAGQAIDYSIQPSLGSDDAPAKVMLFEDFGCSACATFTDQIFPKLKAEFLDNGQAEFFFINHQFLGPNSIMAGMAGECAYEQSESLFWDYKTILFQAQNKIRYDAPTLANLANSISGLDSTALATCIDERRYMESVMSDLTMGKSMGVAHTPSVFVNGQMVMVEYTTRDPLEALGQFGDGIARDIRAVVEVAAMTDAAEETEETTE